MQTPLGVGQQPKPKDQSEGRLILHVKGFIDPEVYTKDSRITLGGVIVNSSGNDTEPGYPYLRVDVREIHLWPVETPLPQDYYWYDRWYPFYPIRIYRR